MSEWQRPIPHRLEPNSTKAFDKKITADLASVQLASRECPNLDTLITEQTPNNPKPQNQPQNSKPTEPQTKLNQSQTNHSRPANQPTNQPTNQGTSPSKISSGALSPTEYGTLFRLQNPAKNLHRTSGTLLEPGSKAPGTKPYRGDPLAFSWERNKPPKQKRGIHVVIRVE